MTDHETVMAEAEKQLRRLIMNGHTPDPLVVSGLTTSVVGADLLDVKPHFDRLAQPVMGLPPLERELVILEGIVRIVYRVPVPSAGPEDG